MSRGGDLTARSGAGSSHGGQFPRNRGWGKSRGAESDGVMRRAGIGLETTRSPVSPGVLVFESGREAAMEPVVAPAVLTPIGQNQLFGGEELSRQADGPGVGT